MRVPSRSMLMPCFVVLGAALLGGALFFAHEKARPGKGTAEATSQVRALAATATHASAWQVPSPAAQSAVTSTVARPAVRVALAPPASASAPIAASRALSQTRSAVAGKTQTLSAASPADSRKALNTLVSLPLSFERNDGQTNQKVRFLSRGAGYTLFLTPEETVMVLRDPPASARCGGQSSGNNARSSFDKRASACPEKIGSSVPARQLASETGYALSMRLLGANHDAAIAGIEELPGRMNYIVGNDPKKWHTNVPTFSKVQYQDIYPGVDLVYYGNQHALEYDLVVAAGADPNVIQIDVRGADDLHLDAAGDLVLQTSVGPVYLKKPEIYQKAGEEKEEVAGNYAIHDGHLVQIELGTYNHALPLVIDPTILVSTYLGGSTNVGDFGHSVSLDLQQAIYIAGQTGSTDFPTTTGSFQPRSSGFAQTQPFITKIKADGSALVYSTFVAGTDDIGSLDYADGLAVDSLGSAWITGATDASDFPLVNPFQSSIGGANTAGPAGLNHGCAFLTKLKPDGSGLLFSTYFCGRDTGDNTQANTLALDSSGNPTFGGFTTSLHLPLANPLQATLNGPQNAFVAKFTSAGAIVYSTYLGGDGQDQVEGIAVDSNGDAYATGYTSSTNFPTKNPFQASLGGSGVQNAFITQIKSDGSAVLYSTYLGGDNSTSRGQGGQGESGFGIAALAPGKVVVVGQTGSDNFPTANAIQPETGGGNFDGFVTEILTNGSSPIFSTYVGGSDNDFLLDVTADAAGNVYFSGGTASRDLATVNPLQAVLGGASDVLIGSIKPDGSAYNFLTYIGLSGLSNSEGIAVDNASPVNLYITGTTNSASFPTVSPFQPNLLTSFDFQGNQASTAFVMKLSSVSAPGVTIFPPTGNFGFVSVGTVGPPGAGTITNNSSLPITILSYQFTGPNGSEFGLSPSSGAVDTCVIGTPLPVGQDCVQHFSFSPSAEGTRTGTLTVTYNSGGANSTVSAPLTGQGVLPAVSVNPTSVDFGDTALGGSPFLPFTTAVIIVNQGGGPLTVGNVHIIGPNASSFSAAASDCALVPPLQSCAVSLGFKPLTVGSYSATLEIDDNAPGSPHMVPLAGNGILQITFPAAINFATTPIGGTNDITATAQLTNGTAAPLMVSSVTITGPNAGDFSIVIPPIAFDELCQAGAVVPPLGGICDVNVLFKPTGTGNRTATLTLTDNGAGSPRAVALSGIGSNTVQAFPNPFDFGGVTLGNQQTASIVLQDDAATAVSVTQLTITGPNAADFSISGSSSCQAAANGGLCFFNLSFIPTILGGPTNIEETATLTINYTGAAGSPITVPLQGLGLPNTGFAFTGVFLLNNAFSTAGLDFGGQLLNEPSVPPMVLGFYNQNPTPLTIGSLTVSGTNPTDFAIVPGPQDCTAGQVLGAGGTCAIHVTFTAAAMGSRSANLSVSYTGQFGSPVSVPLMGMGVPQVVTTSDTILDFGNQVINSGTFTQTVFLLNGNTPFITLGNPAVTLTPSSGSPFVIDSATTCVNNLSLAGSGSSCAVAVDYSPTALGTQTATLTFTDGDPGSPRTVTVTGTGVNAQGASAGFSPLTIDFQTETVNITSAPQTAMLTNSGSVTLNISAGNSVFLSGPNAADFAISSGTTCVSGGTVAVESSCNVVLTFTPSALGVRSAALTVIDDSAPFGFPNPTQTVLLTGMGVSATISVTPASLTYGTVPLGSVATPQANQKVNVVNGSNASITVLSVTFTGANLTDFATTFLDCQANQTLAASGGSCTITPTFAPTVNGGETATLNVLLSDAPGAPRTVALTGTGLSQITLNPTALAFGNVSVGIASAPTLNLSVTNNTATSITFPNLSDTITGANASDFVISPDNCSTPAGTPPHTFASGASCIASVTFTPGASGSRTATLNLGITGNPQTVPLSGMGTAPVVSLNPTSLSFGSQQVQSTSTALPITITNTGTDTLNLIKFVFSGAAGLDYAEDSTSTCIFPNGTLAAGANCVLSINFTPSATGTRTATLTLMDNSGGSATTQTVPLSGTGGSTAPPTAQFSTTTLTFAGQAVGTTSAAQSVTLTNAGGANLVLGTTPPTLGGAGSSDYAIASGTTCTANLSIAPGGTCVVNVTFAPLGTGTFPATLTFTDNSGGTVGSTQQVILSGTGTPAAPLASVLPTSLTFARQTVNTTSAAQFVSVANNGGANLVLAATAAVTISGTNAVDFAIATGTTCTNGVSIPNPGTCTINVTFTPTATGTRTATLTITDNSGGTAGTTQTVSLTGTGDALAPTINVSPTSLTFPGQMVNTTSSNFTVTVANTSSDGASLTMGATPVSFSGPNGSDFAAAVGNTTCTANFVVPPNGVCTIGVTITPSAVGPRTGTMTITDNAGGVVGTTQTVALSGTGTAGPTTATLAPATLTFTGQHVGTTATAQTLTLSNTGTSPLTLAATNAVQISGANAADFAIATGTTCTNGSSLPVATTAPSTCVIKITFKPGAVGARTATVTVTDSATPTTQTATLTGTGIAGAVTLNPTSLTFPGQNVGAAGTPLASTLTNSGTDTLTFAATNALVISGPNAADFTLTGNTSCGTASGAVLTASGACNIAVAFTPGGVGTRTATLTITDDAGAVPGSTQTLPLSGTGLGPIATLNPTSVNFPPTILNTTSAPVNVTLTNTGNQFLNIFANVTISGANTGDFAVASGTTCTVETSVQVNGSCIISFTFTPSATGARNATATVSDSAGTQTIALSGATPNIVGLSTNVLNFGVQGLNAASNPLTVTVTNKGLTPLTFNPGPAISGTNATDFALASTTTCLAGTPIAPNGTCVVNVTFTPTALGTRGPATLTLSDNGGIQTITLNGTGADFSITGPTKPVIVNPGQLATFPIIVTPGPNGFAGTITFCALAVAPATCFPNGVAAEFPQPMQTPNGNSVTTNLWVFTTGPGNSAPGVAPLSFRNQPMPPSARWYALLGLLSVFLFLAWVVTQWRRQKLARVGILVPALAVLLAAIAFTGCGGGGSSTSAANNFTPAGTFQVLVQATSGTTMRTTVVTVQVQ